MVKAVAQYVNNAADAKRLEEELILTLEDVARLDGADWKQLNVSPATKSLLQAKAAKLHAGKPAGKPKPAVGHTSESDSSGSEAEHHQHHHHHHHQHQPKHKHKPAGGHTSGSASSGSDISSGSDFKSSSESELSGSASSGSDTKPHKKKVSNVKAWKKSQKAHMDGLTAEKLRVVNQAIRAAHRLALRAELESIRRADDLAKLQRKRAELARLYKRYKTAARAK